MCYKHRGARDFWDPELRRTFLEWEGRPVSVYDRVKQMCGPGAFWPKNQLHRRGYEHTFERYDRVGLRNSSSAGWHAHGCATTGGWMAIVCKNGKWVSGIYWEGTEIVAQNAPDYGCVHAGIALGYDIRPGQTVSRQGTIVVGQMDIEGFMARYQEDLASWQSAGHPATCPIQDRKVNKQ